MNVFTTVSLMEVSSRLFDWFLFWYLSAFAAFVIKNTLKICSPTQPRKNISYSSTINIFSVQLRIQVFALFIQSLYSFISNVNQHANISIHKDMHNSWICFYKINIWELLLVQNDRNHYVLFLNGNFLTQFTKYHVIFHMMTCIIVLFHVPIAVVSFFYNVNHFKWSNCFSHFWEMFYVTICTPVPLHRHMTSQH